MQHITRATQQTDRAYRDRRHGWFVTPDGDGRLWYDTWQELVANHGELPVEEVTVDPYEL